MFDPTSPRETLTWSKGHSDAWTELAEFWQRP